MADEPAKPATQQPPQLEFRDVPHAPIIYFEGAPNFGNRNGIINISLVAVRHVASNNAAPNADIVVVADLRCTIDAALSLRKSIDDALLLGVKMEGQAN